MPPALSNKALATVLSVVASGLAWAGPTVSGPYLGERYGPVEFRTEGERVVGTVSGTGGACNFAPGTEVLKGELQGHVLVASVLLCQTGPQCAERESHDVLLVMNPYDRVLSGLVRLSGSCMSPGLVNNSQLVLKSTAAQDDAREGEPEPDEAGTPAPPAPDKAAVVVPKPEASSPAVSLELGQRQLAAGNPAVARRHFEDALEADARNPAAVVGLAACQLGVGDVAGALKTLEPMRVSTRPDAHLWLAYAHLRDRNRQRSRESLRRAMELGWAPGNRPAEKVPEEALRSDIELLLQQRNRKRSSGAGSTSP